MNFHNPYLESGDRVRFNGREGVIVGTTELTLAIRLPGQRPLFRCFRQSDVKLRKVG